jgi:hypothetical protein
MRMRSACGEVEWSTRTTVCFVHDPNSHLRRPYSWFYVAALLYAK